MENRQRSIRKLLWRITAVLAVLAVVSICFVSGTFARYVTQRQGAFDSGVALWKITDEVTNADGEVSINLDKISPNRSPATITGEPAGIADGDRRSKELTNITVKITNEGDVNAYVSLTLGTVFSGYQYVFVDNGDIQTDDDGERALKTEAYEFVETPTNPADGTIIPTAEQWKKIFTAEWGTAQLTTPATEEGGSATTEPATPEEEVGDYQGMYPVLPGQTLSVTVAISWNTDLDSDTDFVKDVAGCIDADYRDTWIGQNIGKITLAYSWYAVQGSEMPAEDNTP